MLEGAGNLLLTRACLESLQWPWFDPEFALSGGEDRDFFERLAQAQKRFAWADEAIAYTIVPEVRKSLRWTLERAYSIGNTDMRISSNITRHRAVVSRNLARSHWRSCCRRSCWSSLRRYRIAPPTCCAGLSAIWEKSRHSSANTITSMP